MLSILIGAFEVTMIAGLVGIVSLAVLVFLVGLAQSRAKRGPLPKPEYFCPFAIAASRQA